MSHECPYCGELCYCDMEDHLNEDGGDACEHWSICEGRKVEDDIGDCWDEG